MRHFYMLSSAGRAEVCTWCGAGKHASDRHVHLFVQEWSQNLLKKLTEEEAADFKAKSSAGIKFLLGKLKELQL